MTNPTDSSKEIKIPKEFIEWAEGIAEEPPSDFPGKYYSWFICSQLRMAEAIYRHLHPSPSGWIDEVIKMRDQATKRVNQLKDADGDDEFSELNYYHGQQVALDQVLLLIKHASGEQRDEFVNR